MGSYDFGSSAWDVVVNGNYAFVGADVTGSGVGFRIVDVSDPSNPIEVANHLTNGSVERVALSGNYAYLSGPQIIVLDVFDPLSPSEVARCDTWQLNPQIAPMPPFIYGSTWRGHLLILSADIVSAVPSTAPTALHLDQNYPNPFNPSTTITFTVPGNTHVTLSIFDVAGKHVATLVDGTLPAGPRSVQWNGKDTSGNVVRSGVYFYRVTAGEELIAKKMILLK